MDSIIPLASEPAKNIGMTIDQLCHSAKLVTVGEPSATAKPPSK
ncbi:MAG: hypothetical protein WB819_15600 [Terriglobia bacterium]|jgi:hypothetical protein